MSAIAVSVVVPTYRRPDLLARCLQALMQQTLAARLEVIIVSDGADPQTAAAVANARESRPACTLRYLELDAKKGPAAARNLGWRSAQGTLIAFTDDDCLPDMHWAETMWDAFVNHGEGRVTFTGKVIVPRQPRPTDYAKNTAHLETADFVTANCACSREALAAVYGFDEAFPAAWREDSALEFAFLKNNIPIIRIAAAVVTHPVREAAWGVSLKEQRKSAFNALLFKKHPDLYRQKIASGPVWEYYGIILSSILAVAAMLVGNASMAGIFAGLWLLGILRFTHRRCAGTCPSLSHRLEMFVTSMLIPYLSVYWTIRGAMRYKVFFL